MSVRARCEPTRAAALAALVVSLLACASAPRGVPYRDTDMLPLRQPPPRAVERRALAAFRHYFAVMGVTAAADFFMLSFRDAEPFIAVYAVPVAPGAASRPRLVRQTWGGIIPFAESRFDPRLAASVQAIRADVERHHGRIGPVHVQHLGRYREVHVQEWMPVDFTDKPKRAARWSRAVLAVDAALQSTLRVVDWEAGLTSLCGADGNSCDRAHFVDFPVTAPSAVLQLPRLLAPAAEAAPAAAQREFAARVLSAARAVAHGEPAAPPPPVTGAALPGDLDMHLDLIMRVGDGRKPLEQRIALPLNEALFTGLTREVQLVLGGVPLRARVLLRPDCAIEPDVESDRDVHMRIEVELSDDRGRSTTSLYWLYASVAVANRVVGLRSFSVRDEARPVPIARAAQVLVDRVETSIEHTAMLLGDTKGLSR